MILVYVCRSNLCLHWCFVKQIAWSYLRSGGILHGGLWPSVGTEVKARFSIDIQFLADPEKIQVTESLMSNLERPLLGSNNLQN